MKFTRLQKLLAILFLLLVYPAFLLIGAFIVPTVRDWWNAEAYAASAAADQEMKAGQKHANKKEWESAIASFTRAIESLPESLANKGNSVAHTLGNYYYLRGNAHQQNNNINKALADLTDALRLSPRNTYYLRRANIYNELKEYDKAIADFTKAINSSASRALYAARARAYTAKGDTEKAAADRNKAELLLAAEGQGRLARYGLDGLGGGFAPAPSVEDQATDQPIRDAADQVRRENYHFGFYFKRGKSWKSSNKMKARIYLRYDWDRFDVIAELLEGRKLLGHKLLHSTVPVEHPLPSLVRQLNWTPGGKLSLKTIDFSTAKQMTVTTSIKSLNDRAATEFSRAD